MFGRVVTEVDVVSVASLKNSSRVPAYSNPKKIVGFCDFLFKPRFFEKRRGLVKRLKPSLGSQGGLGGCGKLGYGGIPQQRSKGLPF